MTVDAPFPRRLAHAALQLWRFGRLQLRACAFAIVIFAGLAASTKLPLPVARYDALLAYGILATLAFWALRLETGREIVATAAFHVTGLAFELAKVRLGSWAYPDAAVSKVGGVPLYSGFMYAAVGSYIARAWRLHDLRFTRYRPRATAVVAALIYVNFFTHHWLPDARLLLAGALLVVTFDTHVHFTVGRERCRMPLALSFGLIGFFLWLAENLATIFQAWRYPHQSQGWAMVHVSKFGSWALLVVVSFVLVATWKTRAAWVEQPLLAPWRDRLATYVVAQDPARALAVTCRRPWLAPALVSAAGRPAPPAAAGTLGRGSRSVRRPRRSAAGAGSPR